MGRASDNPALRTKLNHLTVIGIFLMWEGFFRLMIEPNGILPRGVDWPLNLFWLMRELPWCYTASAMFAVLATFSLQSTACAALRDWWRRRRVTA